MELFEQEKFLTINPRLTGYLIFCFRELRDVQLIELRNGFQKKNQYILVSQVENIVSSYHRTKQDFLEKSKSGNFCKKKYISELIDIYREHFKVLEQGSFVV